MIVTWGQLNKELTPPSCKHNASPIKLRSTRSSTKERDTLNNQYNSIIIDKKEYFLGQSILVKIPTSRTPSMGIIYRLHETIDNKNNIKLRLLLQHKNLDIQNRKANNKNDKELFYSNKEVSIKPRHIISTISVVGEDEYNEAEAKARGDNKNLDEELENVYYCSRYYDATKKVIGGFNWSQCYHIQKGEKLSKLITPEYEKTLFGHNSKKPLKPASPAENQPPEIEYKKITRKLKRLSITNNKKDKVKDPKKLSKPALSSTQPSGISFLDSNKPLELQLEAFRNDTLNSRITGLSIKATSKLPYVYIESDQKELHSTRNIYRNSNTKSKTGYFSSDSEYSSIEEDSDILDLLDSEDEKRKAASKEYLNIRLPVRTTIDSESQEFTKSNQNGLSESNKESPEFSNVLSNLHVSSTPDTLPCRENECMEIFSEVYEALETTTSCCLYISGVPGTGKTATVLEVIKLIISASESGDIPGFDFIEINGMKLTEPQQLYVQLWQGITSTNSKITASHAATLLENYFTRKDKKEFLRMNGVEYYEEEGDSRMTIVFVDELDVLVTKSQSIMYNLFDWPSRPNSRLVIITVANTMDLPERMLHHKISSRLGLKRINFSPYTHEQLAQIVMSRIGESSVFDPDAVQLCARKISAVSGDARRALDVCRRAVEIVENNRRISNESGETKVETEKIKVTMRVIEQVVREMYSYGFIPVIQNASLHQKIVLLSIRAALRTCGLPETSLGEVIRFHSQFSNMFGVELPNPSQVTKLVMDLCSLGCILIESAGHLGPYRQIRLNISEDDIVVALRPDPLLGKSVA
ncbi:hypothetical protein BB559_000210 [Furculomyces boomerangus]|uniref:Origin recognition complex subunit 1 n=2 Tax=Harpellales TaxID=61421 RepID=A0A2T9Z5Z3_9FUNG|nr:hypothetical protein BB559_000210 [Furculomyces boomerangus]PWA01720.1 hypothetical protein BB558_002160 [Smittium angustum]